VTLADRRSLRRTAGATAVEALTGRWQVAVYLAAVLAGLAVGAAVPDVADVAEPMVWPTLGLLLLTTFLQVPLRRLPEAARDRRFLAAVVVGNFVAVPVAVWGLLALLPDDPALRLGVALVLLVPCTDWFIVFAHLGGGDARRAIVVTPLNLLLQLGLVPAYLWLLLGDAVRVVDPGRAGTVLVLLVVAPLVTAWWVQRAAGTRPRLRADVARLEHAPVALLAVVLLLVAASQVGEIAGVVAVLPPVLGAFVGYLLLALLLGRGLARGFALPPASARSLTFSLGTRNSFVVLPFALALPETWHLAVAVIVLQSLVELFGMLGYLKVVPLLHPGATTDATRPR
jgi:arsenite transporter